MEKTSSYEPRSILITGGAGFIGSHVLDHLSWLYPSYKLVCFDKLDYCASLRNLEGIKNHPNFKLIVGDITESSLVQYVMKEENIDTIVHFAAQTHVDNSFGNSLLFTQSNVLGTHVLLESARAMGSKVERFVHVSTDEVYGESRNDAPFLESAVLNPTNPYAATKAAAEFLVKAYHTSFGLPTIITRSNNIFGPRQFPEKVIPKFIHLLSRGRPCPIHGDGSHKRGYIYSSDVAAAFDIILHSGQIGKIYNIGSDVEVCNVDMHRLLCRLMHIEKFEEHRLFVENRAFNDQRYHIDTSRLRELGWEPKVSFEEGMKLCLDWHLNNPNYFDNIEISLVPHPRRNLPQQQHIDWPMTRSSVMEGN